MGLPSRVKNEGKECLQSLMWNFEVTVRETVYKSGL